MLMAIISNALKINQEKNNIETIANIIDVLNIYYPRHVIINTVNKYYSSSHIRYIIPTFCFAT